MKPPSIHRFQQTLSWILLVIVLLAAGLLQARWVTLLDHGGETSEDESDSLVSLVRYTADQPLYLDYRQPPHLLTPYMPLFYVIPGTVARWLHCDKLNTIVVGRCYVYLCWLGIGWLIYWLARQAGAAHFPSMMGAVLWFAVEIAPTHGVSYRPDGPQLFFSLAAIGVYLRADRWPNVMGATALLVLAFLQKQSAVAPVLALGAFGFYQGRPGKVFAAVVVWTGVIGSVYLFMQRHTGGLFSLNCFQSLGTVGTLSRAVWVFKAAIARGLPALLGAVFCWFIRPDSTPAVRVWRWYFVLTFGLALTGSMKFGSSSNYYLEPFAVGCILMAVWLTADATQHEWQWLVLISMAVAVTFNSIADTIKQRAQWLPALLAHSAAREQERRQWDDLTHCLGLPGAPLLIEDPYLAFRQPTAPYLLNASFLNALEKDGHFDGAGILRDLNAARFTAVVTVLRIEDRQDLRHFPAHWLDAINQHYRLARTCRAADGTGLYVYLPILTNFSNVPMDNDLFPHSP